MPEQPLALKWLCYIRDNKIRLSNAAGNLARLLPTYGQGKNIYVSLTTLKDVSGMSWEGLLGARDQLLELGLIEDITKDEPGKKPKQRRTYRLTIPENHSGEQSGTTLVTEVDHSGEQSGTTLVSRDIDQASSVDQYHHHTPSAPPGEAAGGARREDKQAHLLRVKAELEARARTEPPQRFHRAGRTEPPRRIGTSPATAAAVIREMRT